MTEEEMDLKYERSEKFDDYYFGRLKMCGCGKPNMIKNFIYELLINHTFYKDDMIDYETMKSKRSDIIKSVDPDVVFEIIYY